jgi:hypothetical protein
MAWDFTNINQAPATGSEAIFKIKATLKLAGWTIPSSGDGLSYFSGSDGITHAGSGSGGQANTGAWWRAKMPTGGREILIQRSSSNLNWWMQQSFSVGFTGGSPSATVAPTASDAKNVSGTSSSGTPWFTTDNTYKIADRCTVVLALSDVCARLPEWWRQCELFNVHRCNHGD